MLRAASLILDCQEPDQNSDEERGMLPQPLFDLPACLPFLEICNYGGDR